MIFFKKGPEGLCILSFVLGFIAMGVVECCDVGMDGYVFLVLGSPTLSLILYLIFGKRD